MENELIEPLKKELEKVYDYLNKKYSLDLPSVALTFQSQGKRRHTKGWFWKDKWIQGDKTFCEINICSEHLDNGLGCAETLIHEMNHAYNFINKIKDTTQSGYHNRKFKVTAEKLGLIVKQHKLYGFCITELNPVLIKELDLKVNFQTLVFNLKRTKPTKKKFSLIKVGSGVYLHHSMFGIYKNQYEKDGHITFNWSTKPLTQNEN